MLKTHEGEETKQAKSREQSYHSALVVVTRVRRIGSEAVLVREGAESVGAEVDEGFHVLLL